MGGGHGRNRFADLEVARAHERGEVERLVRELQVSIVEARVRLQVATQRLAHAQAEAASAAALADPDGGRKVLQAQAAVARDRQWAKAMARQLLQSAEREAQTVLDAARAQMPGTDERVVGARVIELTPSAPLQPVGVAVGREAVGR
jgi:hypothetical protein